MKVHINKDKKEEKGLSGSAKQQHGMTWRKARDRAEINSILLTPVLAVGGVLASFAFVALLYSL